MVSVMVQVKIIILAGSKAENVVSIDKKRVIVEDILQELGINRETVIVRLNGRLVPEEEELRDGDLIEIIRVVSGG